MRKLTTKFLILVFLGLFGTTVSFSYAQAEGENVKSHGGAHGILLQDAAEFLDGKISGTAEIENMLSQTVVCGAENCNLKNNVCMSKPKEGEQTSNALTSFYSQNSFLNQGFGNQNAWIFGFDKFDYVCVAIKDQERYTQKGWSVYKQKQDDNKEVEKCYQATNKTKHITQYCIRAIGGEVEVKAANDEKYGCEVIPVRWYNNSKCTFCSLLGGAYKVADTITATSRNKLAKSFAIITALGMLIWIAMKTVVFVSSMTKQDAAKYITEMIKQSYKFMIAFFALMFYDDIFVLIILPLLKSGIAFGYEFVSVIDINERFELPSGSSMEDLFAKAQEEMKSDYVRNKNNQYYDFATYVDMENLAYNVNMQYALLQSIGGSLVCLGWNFMLGNLEWNLGLGIDCVIYGVAFSAFGFFLCMAFVFYLFDAVVQLGIVGGLLPFLIASWPFKITSKYTSTGFKMLLNSIFTFMMIGVAVKIGMELIKAALDINAAPETSQNYGMDLNSGTSLQDLSEAIDKVDATTLKKMVNVLSVGFCLFMFANIMGFLLIARMSELVNRFAGGGMKGAAPSIATMGASTMRGMAAKVAAPTMNAMGDWARDKVEKTTRAVAKAPVSIAKGVGKGTVKAGKWLDNKTGNVVSNKAKAVGNAVNEGARQVGSSIANSGVGRWTRKKANQVANSKAGKAAKAVGIATKDVYKDVTGHQSKTERQEGIENAQREIFDKKKDVVLGGQRPDTDNMD